MALFRRLPRLLSHFLIIAILASFFFIAKNAQAASPQGPCAAGEYNSAFGCISTYIVPDSSGGKSFVTSILQLGVGLGSGFALVLMLYGTFLVSSSEGIPDRIKAGQEIITSAAMGLIFMLVSIFMLNFVGVKILAIPGL